MFASHARPSRTTALAIRSGFRATAIRATLDGLPFAFGRGAVVTRPAGLSLEGLFVQVGLQF